MGVNVMNRRQVLTGLGSTVLGLAASGGTARAQNWPTRPVRMVVPFAPGGGADATGRIVAEALGAALGQNVVVENRGGGGGTPGAATVAQSAPDGYTLLYGTPGPLITNPILMKDMPYAVKDFAPVSLLTRGSYLLAVNADLPVRSVADLIRLGKEKPGSLTFSSSGIGAGSHLAGELLAVEAGLQMVHVPYRGSGPSIQDVAAGRVSFTIDTYPIMIPLIDAGKLRPIAVSGATRMKELPDVPTIAETVPGFDVTVINYLCVRAGTPRPVIDRLNAALKTVLAEPEVIRRAAQAGAGDATWSSPEELGSILKSESDKWRSVIERAKISIE
jgi:tripartite-type tricarboxylate transporter receptor subunit TctC